MTWGDKSEDETNKPLMKRNQKTKVVDGKVMDAKRVDEECIEKESVNGQRD
jgi:hypothetical protein